MVTVLFILPGMFMIFDKLIVKTSIDFLGKKKEARRAAFAQRRNPQLQAAVQTAGAASSDGGADAQEPSDTGAFSDTGVTSSSGDRPDA